MALICLGCRTMWISGIKTCLLIFHVISVRPVRARHNPDIPDICLCLGYEGMGRTAQYARRPGKQNTYIRADGRPRGGSLLFYTAVGHPPCGRPNPQRLGLWASTPHRFQHGPPTRSWSSLPVLRWRFGENFKHFLYSVVTGLRISRASTLASCY